MTPDRCTAILIILIIIGTGCTSGNPDNGSPVYYQPSPKQAPRSVFTLAEDALILNQIKNKIFSDDLVDKGKIDIQVRHGVVFLEGNAEDLYHRRMIIDIIQAVEGVVRIESHLGVIH